MLEKLSEDYSDKMLINMSVFPGSTNNGPSDVVVEPYNTILSMNSLVQWSKGVFFIENAALYRICQNNLKIKAPSFSDINYLVG